MDPYGLHLYGILYTTSDLFSPKVAIAFNFVSFTLFSSLLTTLKPCFLAILFKFADRFSCFGKDTMHVNCFFI